MTTNLRPMAQLSECVVNDVAGTAELSSPTVFECCTTEPTQVLQSECSTDSNDGKSSLLLL